MKLSNIVLCTALATMLTASMALADRNDRYPDRPPVRRGSDILRMAQDLVDATDRVYRDARYEQRDNQQLRAVKLLENLYDLSRDFYDRVEFYGGNPHNTEIYFQELVQKYEAAERGMQNAYFSYSVRNEFQLVTDIMRDISEFYNDFRRRNPPTPRPHDPWHDPYDPDRPHRHY